MLGFFFLLDFFRGERDRTLPQMNFSYIDRIFLTEVSGHLLFKKLFNAWKIYHILKSFLPSRLFLNFFKSVFIWRS